MSLGDATPRDRPRRPAHKVRSKLVTISVTPSDFDYLDGACRRAGKSMARLLGDLVEKAIREEGLP